MTIEPPSGSRSGELLLAIKALADTTEPTVGTLAEQLHIRHHSAVELVNRAEGHGLVKRARLGDNKSYVFVSLTKKGERMLERAVTERLKELRVAGPALRRNEYGGPNDPPEARADFDSRPPAARAAAGALS